jgi:hypothetical protein
VVFTSLRSSLVVCGSFVWFAVVCSLHVDPPCGPSSHQQCYKNSGLHVCNYSTCDQELLLYCCLIRLNRHVVSFSYVAYRQINKMSQSVTNHDYLWQVATALSIIIDLSLPNTKSHHNYYVSILCCL